MFGQFVGRRQLGFAGNNCVETLTMVYINMRPLNVELQTKVNRRFVKISRSLRECSFAALITTVHLTLHGVRGPGAGGLALVGVDGVLVPAAHGAEHHAARSLATLARPAVQGVHL